MSTTPHTIDPELTWDEVLDDFSDLIDEINDALDAGQVPPMLVEIDQVVPDVAPDQTHVDRFAELNRQATEVAHRVASMMDESAAALRDDRTRVRAHRAYADSAPRSR